METKDIYNDRYTIYSNGQLWSNLRNKFLSPSINNSGYSTIPLRERPGGKAIGRTIHSLVAEAFLPKPADADVVEYEIDHIDDNKQNNDVSNLRWVTHWENMHKESTVKKMRDIQHDPEVIMNRQLRRSMKPRKIYEKTCNIYIVEETNKEYYKLQDLADELGVTSARICQVLNDDGIIRGIHITKTRRTILC